MTGGTSGPVTGYRLILPRPWSKVPLGDDATEHVRDVVSRGTADWDTTLPPDQAGPLRRQLQERLLTQVRAARRAGGVDLYLPVGDARGLLVGASFVVSEISSPAGSHEAVQAELVRRELLTDGGTAVQIGTTTWVRQEAAFPPDPDQPDLDVPTRRVTYAGPFPDASARWILVGFSCVGDGDPDSDNTAVVVQLFDAIMGTWVWTRDAADPGPVGEEGT